MMKAILSRNTVLRTLLTVSIAAAAALFSTVFCCAGGEKNAPAKPASAGNTAVSLDTGDIPSDVREAVRARSAILIEQTTGQVLFELNADEPRAPASITKVMTVLLVMEAIDDGRVSPSDTVTASEHACSMGGSQIWLEPGETMTVDELLRATCIASSNDAAVALAEFIGGSEQGFVELMNAKAAELGMTNTCFKNASGLDEEGHFTTARDIAAMSAALLKHERIKNYSTVWMDSLRDGKTQLVNTNKLIRFYKGATGLKTGTTDQAGRCVSASAARGDMNVIAVILGAESRDTQFSSAAALMNYAFDSYTMASPPDISDQLRPVSVDGGVLSEITPVCAQPEKLLVRKGAEKTLEQTVELPESITAPVAAGQQIGRVVIRIDGEEAGEYALCSPCDVGEMTFGRAFGILFSSLF